MFGADTWVLTETMIHQLEVGNVSSLRKVTRIQAERRRDGYWRQVKADEFLLGVGTQTLRKHVDRQHATVAEWVATRPIFDVCARETGYEGGERLQVPWWRRKAV